MPSIDKFQETRLEILSVFLVQVCFLYGLTFFFLGRLTVKLRYYPKEYVQEFMAATTSLLLRNASEGQLRKGILYYDFLNQFLAWSIYFYFAILMKMDKKIPVFMFISKVWFSCLHMMHYWIRFSIFCKHYCDLDKLVIKNNLLFNFSVNKLFSGILSALFILSQTQVKPKILAEDHLWCKLVEYWLILCHFAK